MMTGFIRSTFLLIFIGLALASCKEEVSAPDVKVYWKHLTNFTNDEGVFESEFKLEHKGGKELTDNWALFFNISPRRITEPIVPQKANIEHINGDWYKMVPTADFSLEEGETISILYRGEGFMIKDTDRPLGLYFVYYDKDGNEQELVEVKNYEWEQLTTPVQVNRSKQDFESIPVPVFQFALNQHLTELPENELPLLIPTPINHSKMEGAYTLTDNLVIECSEELINEANYLKEKLKEDHGLTSILNGEGTAQLKLRLKPISVMGKTEEAYLLNIDKNGIEISGADAAGVFYGLQSLQALIPVQSYNKGSVIELPFVKIEDAPGLAFRGLHLDVGRNFQSKETVLKLLDIMSFYKLNHFLFYLTEDEGWRIEIEGLPELTEIGAKRQHTGSYHDSMLQPAYGSGPFANAEGKHGHGFYSKEEFIEILSYAHERHITVIPQVNFPGHARAAIKAMEYRYDRLMKEGKEEEANEYRLIDPDDSSQYVSAQSYKDNVVCVVRESAYRFYEKVLDEIASMYEEAGVPLTKFHMGGDEVPSGAWTKSPLVNEFLSDHPEVGGPEKLHAYFVRTIIDSLKDRGLEWHGWEEIALQKNEQGEYHPNPEFATGDVVPYIWNNLFDYPDIGYRLANSGYPVVLCNVSNFYFDLAYNKDPQEPGLYWAGFIDVKDAWTFAAYNMYRTTIHTPMGQNIYIIGTEEKDGNSYDVARIKPGNIPDIYLERLKPEAKKNILGIQAQLWSETIKGGEMLEYYYLPKLMGFAESAWSERAWASVDDELQRRELQDKEWNTFVNKLARHELPRLSHMNGGYNYRVPKPGLAVNDGMLQANSEYPGLIIRYTLDGKDPDVNSEQYTMPLEYSTNITYKFRCFDSTGKGSKVVEAIK